MAELICVDNQYNEIDCADSRAAFQVTREDAKARRKELGLPEVEEKAVTTAPENKAVSVAPQNKGKK